MPYIDEAHTLIDPTKDEQIAMKHTQSSRYTYWADGEWRINFDSTEYSGFTWIDRLAAFENLSLDPAEVQRCYDNCVQFLNAMDGISLAEIQEYVTAKKENRVCILSKGQSIAKVTLPPTNRNPAIDANYTVDPVSNSRAAHLNRFSEAATMAFRNNQSQFVCPVCEKIANISGNGTTDGFRAECPFCGIKVSKW